MNSNGKANGTPPLSAFQAYKMSPVLKNKRSSDSKSPAAKKSKNEKVARPSKDELRRQAAALKTPPPTLVQVKNQPKMTPEERKQNKAMLKLKRKADRNEAMKPPKQYLMSSKLHVPGKMVKLRPDSIQEKWDISFDDKQSQSQTPKKQKLKENHGSSSKKKKKVKKPSRYFEGSLEVSEEPSAFVDPIVKMTKKLSDVNGRNRPENETAVAEMDSSDEDIPMLIELKKDIKTVVLDEDNENELVPEETMEQTETSEEPVGNISRVHLDDDNESSVDKGKELLANIIAPLNLHTFLLDTWEKAPVVITRKKPDYFSQLELTTESLDAMLRNNHIRYTKNIDITTYRDGRRETLNPPGRATPAEVWDFYNDGASVRWINPQTFSPRLWQFCATLQEYFGCFVGANLYLTPPGTQGFAPHYDDIEAFILQLEGSKHWKLYQPRSDGEVLPRYSSGNFDRGEIGEPFMEVTLHAGDVLYFPRGVIHEAVAADTHSLHATLSVYQRNAWADLLEKMIPAALSAAIADDVRLRQGLPIGFLSHTGTAHARSQSAERSAFARTAAELTKAVLAKIDVDAAADQMGLRFIQDALPPVLTEEERKCSMAEDGEKMTKDGVVVNAWAMDTRTKVKLVRAHCIRLVYELGNPKVYYNLDNTREYHEEEPGFFEIVPEMVPCVQKLIQSYPGFISISSLPLDSMEQKVQLVGDFWMKGLLLTHKPIGEDNADREDDDEDEQDDDDSVDED